MSKLLESMIKKHGDKFSQIEKMAIIESENFINYSIIPFPEKYEGWEFSSFAKVIGDDLWENALDISYKSAELIGLEDALMKFTYDVIATNIVDSKAFDFYEFEEHLAKYYQKYCTAEGEEIPEDDTNYNE